MRIDRGDAPEFEGASDHAFADPMSALGLFFIFTCLLCDSDIVVLIFLCPYPLL